MSKDILKRYRLGFYEEVAGTLSGLKENEGFLIAEISELAIIFPSEMEAELRPLLGVRLRILHTDILGEEYIIRIIPDPRTDIDQTAQVHYNGERISEGV